MKWSDIRKKYPGKFILIGDIVEEKISDSRYRILEGNVLKVSDDIKEIRYAYQELKERGENVLYSLPSTDDFIVENIPIMSILR